MEKVGELSFKQIRDGIVYVHLPDAHMSILVHKAKRIDHNKLSARLKIAAIIGLNNSQKAGFCQKHRLYYNDYFGTDDIELGEMCMCPLCFEERFERKMLEKSFSDR